MVKQLIENRYQQEVLRDRRCARGMVVAVSCEIIAIDDDQQKETYKVQSRDRCKQILYCKIHGWNSYLLQLQRFRDSIKKIMKNILCKHNEQLYWLRIMD